MNSKISSRERMLTCLHREKPDYVPLNIDFHPSYRSGPLAKAENQFAVIDILQNMGTDPSVDIWLPVPSPHPNVKITYWREKDPDGNGFIRCKQYDTPAGSLRQVVKETTEWNSLDHMLFSRSTLGERTARTPDLEMIDDYNTPRAKEILTRIPHMKTEFCLDKLTFLRL